MSKLKDTTVEGNLSVSGNLKCTGAIDMGVGRIAGRNIPTKISFSRYMR